MNESSSHFDSLRKTQLREMCDGLLVGDSGAVKHCIEFFEAESFGIWHGRARAMMARRFKHCRLSQSQRDDLTSVVLHRFISGQFSEQFKDQLRLALHLARKETLASARKSESSHIPHIRRYAAWLLLHPDNPPSPAS